MREKNFLWKIEKRTMQKSSLHNVFLPIPCRKKKKKKFRKIFTFAKKSYTYINTREERDAAVASRYDDASNILLA